MKTVDLIPFILLELNAQDKYGLELTKAIETKSNGKIVVKQPTLYTVLKKLEKSKFISSYWLDSEIGGKRHYYKLTEFGKLQVSTLPSMEQLVADLLTDNVEIEAITTNSLAEEVQEPKESIIPSDVVFSDNFVSNNIDIATEAEINLNNIEILKEDKKEAELFAENESVTKFTEKVAPAKPINANVPTGNANDNNSTLAEIQPYVNLNVVSPIKYVDYINIKKDENHIKANRIAKQILTKNILVSLSIITALVLFNFITTFSGTSALYYISWVVSLIFAIFYPIVTALRLDKIKDNLLNNKYVINREKSLYVSIIFVLAVTIVIIGVNMTFDISSLAEIFGIKNFENLYAPLLLSCFSLVDYLIKSLMFRIKK